MTSEDEPSGKPPSANDQEEEGSSHGPPQSVVERASEAKKDSDEQAYAGELVRLRAATSPSKLDYYRNLEELSWESDANVWQIRNLAWLLRSKREEARLRSIEAEERGRDISDTATWFVRSAVAITVLGWTTAFGITTFSATKKLDWTWLASTSGAVLLLLASATLLFRVARDHQRRGLRYSDVVEYTRRLETSVRLALACGDAKSEEVAKAFAALAVQLAVPPRALAPEIEPLSALPEVLTEGAAVLAKIVPGKS